MKLLTRQILIRSPHHRCCTSWRSKPVCDIRWLETRQATNMGVCPCQVHWWSDMVSASRPWLCAASRTDHQLPACCNTLTLGSAHVLDPASVEAAQPVLTIAAIPCRFWVFKMAYDEWDHKTVRNSCKCSAHMSAAWSSSVTTAAYASAFPAVMQSKQHHNATLHRSISSGITSAGPVVSLE